VASTSDQNRSLVKKPDPCHVLLEINQQLDANFILRLCVILYAPVKQLCVGIVSMSGFLKQSKMVARKLSF